MRGGMRQRQAARQSHEGQGGVGRPTPPQGCRVNAAVMGCNAYGNTVAKTAALEVTRIRQLVTLGLLRQAHEQAL